MIEVMSVPAVIAMVNVVKKMGVPSWALPVFAIAIGIGTQWLNPEPGAWQARVSAGLIAGLAASGLYDIAPKQGGQTRDVTL